MVLAKKHLHLVTALGVACTVHSVAFGATVAPIAGSATTSPSAVGVSLQPVLSPNIGLLGSSSISAAAGAGAISLDLLTGGSVVPAASASQSFNTLVTSSSLATPVDNPRDLAGHPGVGGDPNIRPRPVGGVYVGDNGLPRTVAPIPLPASALLASCALGALALRRRRITL